MTSARLGNVAAAIDAAGIDGAEGGSVDPALVEALSGRLESLFDETWIVGQSLASPTRTLFDVLAQSRAERVLVVTPTAPLPDIDTLLALTAWPEREAVVFETSPGVSACAIYLREPALARARADGEDAAGLLAHLDVARVAPGDLGLDEGGLR